MQEDENKGDAATPQWNGISFCIRRCCKSLRRLFHFHCQYDERLEKWGKDNLFLDVFLGSIVIWILTGLIWLYCDPFGLDRVTDSYSETIIDRVTSPFYTSTAQDSIAVVLIDESTLAEQGIGWPPSYDYYSQIIYRIMRHAPKVIFVDILLEHERPLAKETLAIARDNLRYYVQEYNVPVYFAQSTPGAKNLFGDIPGVEAGLSAWEERDYPLWVTGESSSGTHEEGVVRYPTAAMALYKAQTSSTEWDKNKVMEYQSPLVVQWGCAVPALTRDKDLLHMDKYEFVDPSFVERAKQSMRLLMYSFLQGLDENVVDSNRQKCPYTLTIKAQDLASQDLQGLLKGRSVFLGVCVDGISDDVVTPANGLLPGVYQHAMALDNLMKYGSSYYTRSQSHVWMYSVLALIMSTLVAFLAGKSLMGVREVRIILVGLIIMICITLYWVDRSAPQNWVGLILICTIVTKLQKRNEVRG